MTVKSHRGFHLEGIPRPHLLTWGNQGMSCLCYAIPRMWVLSVSIKKCVGKREASKLGSPGFAPLLPEFQQDRNLLEPCCVISRVAAIWCWWPSSRESDRVGVANSQ